MPRTLSLAPHPPETLPRSARVGVALGMLGLHAAAAWFVLQFDPVRQAVGQAVPILVEFVVAPTPRPEPTAAPPTPAPRPAPRQRAPSVARPPSPAQPAFVVPAPEPLPAMATEAPTPASPRSAQDTASAAPAPATPAPPAPAPVPKTVAISAVAYLSPPLLHYPAISRRMGEQGQVLVRVLVDAQGAPREARVARSSGYPRLDEAALGTVRATRFRPYTENGIPQPFWVVMPLIFELED